MAVPEKINDRKLKREQLQAKLGKEDEESTPSQNGRRASMADTVSPSLSAFLTPVASEPQGSPPEPFLTARTQPPHAASRPDHTSQIDRWARPSNVCRDCSSVSALHNPSMCLEPGHTCIMLPLPAG